MKQFFYLTFAILLVFTVSACEDDDDAGMMLDVPTNYTFTRAGESTVSFSGQTTRIAMAAEFVSALTDFDQTEAGLDNMFRNEAGTNPFADAELNASTKSIRSKVAASRDVFFADATTSAAIKADFDGWIAAQVSEVFPSQNELADAGIPGQIADGSSVRYVNANGLEYNQAIAKSLIGALMFDQIANNYLSPAVLDEATNIADNDAGTTADGEVYTTMEHKWDEAYGYLYGASSDPANPLIDLGDADGFLNKYVGRVDGDPDFVGISVDIEAAFRRGRAAIVAGDYAERDRQAAVIKANLANVLIIRSIYYLKQGEAALRAEPANFGTAFHDLSEGFGFVYSLRFINNVSGFTPAQVDGWLTSLTNESGNGFWDLDPDVIATIANDISGVFGIGVDQAGS